VIKLDPNKPVQTKEGRQVEIKYTFKNGSHFIVFNDTDSWIIVDEFGVYAHQEKKYDIINTPERIEGWVVVYRSSVSRIGLYSRIFATRADALQHADKYPDDVIACIHSRFTVGEGLEENGCQK